MTEVESVAAGVEAAWDFWLSQHDISTPEIIAAAIEKAWSKYLAYYEPADERVERLANRISSLEKSADRAAALENAAYGALRKFHRESDCGKDGVHWAECERLVDEVGWESWETWHHIETHAE